MNRLKTVITSLVVALVIGAVIGIVSGFLGVVSGLGALIAGYATGAAKLAHAIEKEKKIGKWELLMTHPVTAKHIEALMKMQKGAAA